MERYKLMSDIPLSQALLLWNPGFRGETPAFAVRPVGHDDYDRFRMSSGACYRVWHELAKEGPRQLLNKALIELWHIAAFYEVPIKLIHEAMLVVPEYRNLLADDCLPQEWRWERD